MKIIFNELSIDKQFQNIEEFVDSLSKDMLPAMNYLKEQDGLLFFKSNAIFNRYICSYINFSDFLCNQSFGFPELTRFKTILTQILEEPYWEDSLSTNVDAIYSCSNIGSFPGRCMKFFSQNKH